MLLSIGYAIGQKHTIIRNIEWKTDNKKVFFFSKAVYYDENIPLYSESINLTDLGITSNNLDVNINILTSEPVDFKGTKLINEDIEIEYSVFYGRDILYLNINFYPFYKKSGISYKIIDFELVINESNPKSSKKSVKYAENSVLNSGTWVKIAIPETGVYKITNAELENLGFANPSSVRVFGNDAGELPHWNSDFAPDDLIENTIYRGSDYILFYAIGPQKWKYDYANEIFTISKNIYSDTAYYFLTDKNTGFANNIQTINSSTQTPTETFTKYIYTDYYENNLVNIAHSGRIWLGESFLYNQQQTFSFEIPNLVTSDTAVINIATAARSTSTSSFTYSFAGLTKNVTMGTVSGVHYNKYADYKSEFYKFKPNSHNLDINISYTKPTSTSEAWLDFIVLNAYRQLSFVEQMYIRTNQNIGVGKYSKFQISNANTNVQIWDISEPTNPKKINYNISASNIDFTILTDTLKEFVAFTSDNCLSPVYVGEGLGVITNQNLHNISTTTDMLIVAPEIFLIQAEQIAQVHRSKDNYEVKVSSTEQIYNEFGCGQAGAPEIRNYIKMVYEKTNKKLRFVLLLGDGTFDNFNMTTSENPNFIPTYQTINSFNFDGSSSLVSTTTDDFYALMDEDEGEFTGKLDLAVGRLPVKTTQEADEMVSKIQIYTSPDSYGDWRNIITLLADDNDGDGDFVTDSEKIANKINQNIPFINIKKIYLDAYVQQTSANGEEYPEAVNDLNNRINNGTLILNYLGHGSEEALTAERVVTRNIINSWSNYEKLALFITGTCEFSRFDETAPGEDKTSAGEMVVLNPQGGAVVMLTTARVSYSGSNLSLNDNFYDYLFSKNTEDYIRVGEAYYKAKNDMNNSYYALFFTLLGDPALKLQYAEEKVETSHINDIEIQNFEDTLRALQKVTVKGYVADSDDNILNDYNGVLNLTFFDKRQELQTLNNDGNGAMLYWNQYNVLFRGRASVTNGFYNITYVIPKDIFYNYGYSKFSFYSNSDNRQGTGYFNGAILGGIISNPADDVKGPTIRLFMNDSSFVAGGITNPNPAIFSILNDENGINTSSASFGHDIVATLDENANKSYSLNEYYQSDIDNYKQGSIRYELYKLDEGLHIVKLKAWDTYNNSSEKSISFVVQKDNEIIIEHLLNYPNPFTTNTDFYFEHNKPGMNLDVLLQIFTVSGKLVKTINKQMTTEGFRSEPIHWDGLDDFGNKIGSGVYVYRLKIRTLDGKIAEKYEKLLILK